MLASATAGLSGLSPFPIARNIHHTDFCVMMTYNLFYGWNGTTMTYRIPHETKKVRATASMWTRRDKHWTRSDAMGIDRRRRKCCARGHVDSLTMRKIQINDPDTEEIGS